MKKILVTGGSGFIGTNLVEDLITDKHILLNIDKSKPLNPAHLPYWKSIDILDFDALEDAILTFEPEIIIHLAAVTDLDGNDLTYYNANIQGTKNIIDIAKKLPLLKKVIFTSSMYVCKPGYIPADYNTYKPHTAYGESKVKGELLVKGMGKAHYQWVIIRPTSIWGPWFSIPYIDFFKIVEAGKYFEFGKSCTKTYGYIGNTVFQIRKIVESDRVNKRTFYLGDLPPIQISEWGNEISIEMGKGKIKSFPFFILKIAALAGDLITKIGVKFPITSFRLKNMTTDNILPLGDIYDLTGEVPFDRITGVRKTIAWLNDHEH
jgi:GlcNAc-P-P-Und epimerase